MSRARTRLAAVASAAALALSLAACASSPTPSGDAADAATSPTASSRSRPASPPTTPGSSTTSRRSGEGFEAAVAYAVAEKLGFADEDVVWVRTSFDEAHRTRPEELRLQPPAVLDHRRAQAGRRLLVAVLRDDARPSSPSRAATADGRRLDRRPQGPAASARSPARRASTTIEHAIAPTAGAAGVQHQRGCRSSRSQADQIDAIVVDLPTAFYLTGVELDGRRSSSASCPPDGQPATSAASCSPRTAPLTAKVTAAVDALRDDGTLAGDRRRVAGAIAGVDAPP